MEGWRGGVEDHRRFVEFERSEAVIPETGMWSRKKAQKARKKEFM